MTMPTVYHASREQKTAAAIREIRKVHHHARLFFVASAEPTPWVIVVPRLGDRSPTLTYIPMNECRVISRQHTDPDAAWDDAAKHLAQ
jgi:hypothetical protein